MTMLDERLRNGCSVEAVTIIGWVLAGLAALGGVAFLAWMAYH